jgi:hypothetical protein
MTDDERLLAGLERLGAEIERVARTAEASPAHDHGRRRRPHRLLHRAGPFSRRAVVLALISLVFVAAAAVAATTGLLTGEPVKAPKGQGFKPGRGAGVPIPASIGLTALRVADPAGGLPWGLRTLKTTRGMGCVQLGRVADEKLGVLGQDGVFDDDGKFHELPVDTVGQLDCQVSDAAGHTFIAIGVQGQAASGMRGGECIAPAQELPSAVHTTIPRCPGQDMRIIYYGLLGPRAMAVTYVGDDGHVDVARTSGADGAYLVVVRPSAKHPAKGYWSIGTSPGSGIRSVRYRDAPECRIGNPRQLGGAHGCPLVGFVAPHAARVTTADVATVVRPQLARKTHTISAVGADGKVIRSPEMRRVTLRFRARVASHGAGGGYVAWIELHRARGCSAYGTMPATDRDIEAGQVVTLHADYPASCRGTIGGVVRFHAPGGKPANGPLTALTSDPKVGSFSVRLLG